MLFISHNLAVVRFLSRRIMVIYLGRCVERAARDDLFAKPLHPYSSALLAAASVTALGAQSAADKLPGPPSAGPRSAPPTIGCAYRDRCGYAIAACETIEPPLTEVAAEHFAACHRSREFSDARQVP
jgi:peptide/nickel transport system ATP-binding protein